MLHFYLFFSIFSEFNHLFYCGNLSETKIFILFYKDWTRLCFNLFQEILVFEFKIINQLKAHIYISQLILLINTCKGKIGHLKNPIIIFFYYIWSKKSFANWIKISTIIKARRKIKEEEEESVALQRKLNAILINMQELNMMATFFPLRNRLCNRVLSGIWHCSTIILLRIFKYFLILNYFFICFYCFDILKINI
jgi:hypothetical protein